jgi:hypothetical protein
MLCSFRIEDNALAAVAAVALFCASWREGIFIVVVKGRGWRCTADKEATTKESTMKSKLNFYFQRLIHLFEVFSFSEI